MFFLYWRKTDIEGETLDDDSTYERLGQTFTDLTAKVREAAKKVLFLVVRHKGLYPPPLGLVVIRNFFFVLK